MKILRPALLVLLMSSLAGLGVPGSSRASFQECKIFRKAKDLQFRDQQSRQKFVQEFEE